MRTTRKALSQMPDLLRAVALSQMDLAAPLNPTPAHKLQGYSGYELKALTVDSTVGGSSQARWWAKGSSM
jgi:hypothetical protein